MNFNTRNEAIQHLIINPIEAGDATADEFDIDAIANQALGGYSKGYTLQVDESEFWEIVAQHVI